MRTFLMDEYKFLDDSVKDNGNIICYYSDRLGYYHHSLSVSSLESFNEQRKCDYEKQFVVDGDIICHKEWFNHDKFLEKAFDEYNEHPMDITWDHRFYVVVRSYDGEAYAVNLCPRFYSPLVPGLDKDDIKQTIVPIKDLSDDYVLALTDSYILKRFSDCSSDVVKRENSVISTGATKYKIDESKISALRIIAFINSLRSKGYHNIVISFKNPMEGSALNWLKIHMHQVHGGNLGFFPIFIGHYEVRHSEDVVIARPEVARKYEKNGYLLLDYYDMINGKYVGVDFSPESKFVRKYK